MYRIPHSMIPLRNCCKFRDCRGDTSDWKSTENHSDTADMNHFSDQSGL